MRAFLCMTVIVLAGCGGEPPLKSEPSRSVTIDRSSFPHYPGVLLSLDRAEVVALPKSFDELKITDPDLWIEPRDPEITAITARGAKDLGIARSGEDPRVAVTTEGYDGLVRVPAGCTWLDGLPKESITAGAVFLARSSSGRCYKVRIDAWDKDQGDGLMQLSFAPIAGGS